MRFPGRLYPLLLAAGLSACASNRVLVAYPQPKNPAMLEKTRAMGNLYVLIRKPKIIQNTLIGKAAKKGIARLAPLSRLMFPVDAGFFARRLAQDLERKGANIIAYRVQRGSDEDDPFLKRLKPSGVLTVDFHSLDITREKVETERTVKDTEGKESIEKNIVWKYHARLALSLKLATYPAGKVLSEIPLRINYHQDDRGSGDEPEENAAWYRSRQRKILQKAAKKLHGKFGRIPVANRVRRLYTDKKDPVSKAAKKAADKEKWERASELWVERLEGEKGGWRELANLAVAAEKSREFDEAARIYKKARKAAGDDPEAAKLRWDEIIMDLETAADTVGPRSRAASAWFDAPVAVMPFSDETISIDGPIMLREMLETALRKGGYRVRPIETVDRLLRRHGITQGGHLKRRDSEKHARWTQSQRVVYGHITELDEVMLGFYGRRSVGGKLTMWDRKSGRTIWSSQERAVNETAAKSVKEIGARFAGQLLRGLVERVANKPLGAESALFIRQNVESLPLKP